MDPSKNNFNVWSARSHQKTENLPNQEPYFFHSRFSARRARVVLVGWWVGGWVNGDQICPLFFCFSSMLTSMLYTNYPEVL